MSLTITAVSTGASYVGFEFASVRSYFTVLCTPVVGKVIVPIIVAPLSFGGLVGIGTGNY